MAGSSLIGLRIGAYEVLSLLGSGGMGDVYRARDVRLDRDVALKVVKASLATDPDLMGRLEREARVLAALSHPHIGAIYEVEDVPEHAGVGPGARALVLELISGETLADRIARVFATTGRGLPVREAIEIGGEIVSALDSAHERGVVHRDLKPANVKLTDDQIVKVLDFGLAKPVPSVDATHTPTIASLSRDGLLVGTPAYMSPEQVRGRPVDKRTDIWAFGCVLYELLTGRPAFARATIADTIAAILGDEPDWTLLPDAASDALRQLLRSCLVKDPRRRLRDIGDAHLDAPAILGKPAPVSSAPAGPVSRHVYFQRLTDFPGVNESPAISPDGRMVAFVAMAGARRQLFTVLLSGGTPLQITRDESHHDHPRWAPDSSALIYHTPPEDAEDEGTLWEVPALGGTPRPIVSALGAGDISRSGRHLAFFRLRNMIHELILTSRDGSDPFVVATIPSGHPCKSPRWSPDDRWIAFQSSRVPQFSEQLSIAPAHGGAPRVIATTERSMNGLSWMPDGSALVYSSSMDSTLPYPPVNSLRLINTDGSNDRQVTFGDMSHVAPDVHSSGKLVTCRVRSASDIWRIPTTGSPAENVRNSVRITHQTGQVQTPSASPDGTEVVFLSDNGAHTNLWIARADGSASRQLTFERDRSVTIGVPLWSPAGDWIAFIIDSHRAIGIRLIHPNGRGQRELVPDGIGPCWSPDGKWIYYTRAAGSCWRIEKVRVDGGEPIIVRQDAYLHSPVVGDSVLFFATRPEHIASFDWTICRASPEDGPAETIGRISASRLPVAQAVLGNLSPDGRWLALPLMDGSATNIWAVPTTGGPMRQMTDFEGRSTLIARQVWWSPNGRSIFAAVADIGADVVIYDGLV